MRGAHIEDQNRRARRQRRPVQIVGHVTLGGVAGDKSDGDVAAPRGHRDAGVSQSADAGGNTGHDAEWHPSLKQANTFLGAPAENKRIAALEAQHSLSLLGQPHQLVGDIFLAGRWFAAALARMDQLGAFPGQLQNIGAHKGVINNHIGRLHSVQTGDGEKAGVAGAGAHQPDGAGREFRQINWEVFHGRGI